MTNLLSLIILGTINSSPPEQYGRYLADDIFRCIFVDEKFCILIKNSLKFVSTGPVDKTTASVRVIVWRRTSDKPLSEAILTQLICVYMGH